MGKVLAAQLLDVTKLRRHSMPRLHARYDAFTLLFVGRADHDGIFDVRMTFEKRLDLFWIDLLAARVDRDRPAAQEHDGSVRVDRGDIAGERPAHSVDDDERRLALGFILVVPERQMLAARY
jgi:hypothetical protein